MDRNFYLLNYFNRYPPLSLSDCGENYIDPRHFENIQITVCLKTSTINLILSKPERTYVMTVNLDICKRRVTIFGFLLLR